MGRNEDKGSIQGILEEGFGPVARKVMRDPRLTIGAKGLYSYLVSLAGAGMVTWPKKTTICKELGIHHETYNKYLTQLIELDYVRVTPRRDPNGQFLGNLYTIVAVPKQEIAENSFSLPDTGKNRIPQKPDTGKNRIPKKTVYGKKPDTEKTPIHTTNKIFNKNMEQQQQHFLSNSGNNNSRDNELTRHESHHEQFLTEDHPTKQLTKGYDQTRNNQDIEKEAQNIRDKLKEITDAEVDQKLISQLAALSAKSRENTINAIINYLKNNEVDNIDGLIATAMRNSWKPGKRSMRKKEKNANGSNYRFLYLS